MLTWQQEAIQKNAIVTPADAPVKDPTIVLASARDSQNQERSFHSSLLAAEGQAGVTATFTATSIDVQHWLQDIELRTDKTNRRILNAKQFEMVK